MGCIKSLIRSIPYEIDPQVNEILEEINGEFKGISSDQFLCPECKQVPEILNIYTDIDKIELLCKNCKKEERLLLSFKEYYEKIKNSNNNLKEKDCNGKELHQNNNIHPKNNYNEFKNFCEDCNENVYDNELKINHKGHKIINLKAFQEKFEKNREIIIKKNKELYELFRFNKLIMETQQKYQDNYFYRINMKNIEKSIKREKIRKSEEVEYFKKLIMDGNYYNNNNKKNKTKYVDEIENLPNKNEQFVVINNKNLKDEQFKLISLVKFNQLKELDVSNNEIKNIEPLYRMFLPFLEYLNMSYNEIEDIEPIGYLMSRNLKELFLQNNKIKNIESLSNTLYKLDILRVDGNILDNDSKNKEAIKKIKNNYKYVFLYKDEISNYFDKKIKVLQVKKDPNHPNHPNDPNDPNHPNHPNDPNHPNHPNHPNVLDFTGKKLGDEIIKDLYLIFNDKNESNEIEKLILQNNNISDPSKLKKIFFPKLKILDLSLNKIKNIEFLKEMKLDSLKELYLDNNNINNISILEEIKCTNLEVFTIKENNLDLEEEENKKILDELKKRNSDIEI